MEKPLVLPARSDALKSILYDSAHVDGTFGSHTEPRSNYIVHPEWLSENLQPATTVYSRRRPWPWELPGYRACVCEHPSESCKDMYCYCKWGSPYYTATRVAQIPDQHPPSRVDLSGPFLQNLHESPTYAPRKAMIFKEGQSSADRRELWSHELNEIRGYNTLPEPTLRDERLRNATLQKRWLYDTYTQAVCTPQEGLIHDLQEYNFVNPGVMELPYGTHRVTLRYE